MWFGLLVKVQLIEESELPWGLPEEGVGVEPQQTALLAGEKGELEADLVGDPLADQAPLIDRGVH